jgi:hypothetical protein
MAVEHRVGLFEADAGETAREIEMRLIFVGRKSGAEPDMSVFVI